MPEEEQSGRNVNASVNAGGGAVDDGCLVAHWWWESLFTFTRWLASGDPWIGVGQIASWEARAGPAEKNGHARKSHDANQQLTETGTNQ